MDPNQTNYVYCSWEPLELLYRVYDSHGGLEVLEFQYENWDRQSQREARERAEFWAAKHARSMGIEWGTNYP